MTLAEVVESIRPLLDTKVASAIAPVIVSSTIAAIVALVAYRHKSREPLTAAITWQWTRDYHGQQDEAPFLTIQNRSDVPAYLKKARIRRGNFIKIEHRRYAFSYSEPEDGNYPLEIKARGVSSFPLLTETFDQALRRATIFNKIVSYLFKRPYVWIDFETMGGGRLIVAANDAADFRSRPLWVDLRWLPEHPPKWLRPSHYKPKVDLSLD